MLHGVSGLKDNLMHIKNDMPELLKKFNLQINIH